MGCPHNELISDGNGPNPGPQVLQDSFAVREILSFHGKIKDFPEIEDIHEKSALAPVRRVEQQPYSCCRRLLTFEPRHDSPSVQNQIPHRLPAPVFGQLRFLLLAHKSLYIDIGE